MTLSELGLDALRVSLILGASMVIARALPRRAASLRRLVRATAFGCALLLPFAARLAPAVALPGPSLPTIVARPFAEPASEAAPAGPAMHATIRERDDADHPSTAPIGLGDVALLAWALVSAALLLRLGRAHLKAHGIAARADFKLDPSWRALVDEMVGARSLAVAVGISDEIDTPAAFGIVSSTVLVPRASTSWGEARRRAALAHELSHIGAKDGLARLAAQVVCALHWFDPLAWLAARGLRFDQELVADEAALAGGIAPSRYASDLLEIAGSASRAPAATTAMASRSELERRIRVIVAAAPVFRASRPLSIFALAILPASAMVLACARPPTGDASGGAASVPAPPAAVASPKTAPAGDARLQAIVDEEIARLVADSSAVSAAVIALDPQTGKVLAEAGRVQGAPADVAFGQAFVPGSTFKLVTVAAALDAGLVSAASHFDCAPRAYGAQTLHDASTNGDLTLGEIVARSSNVGVSRIFDALGEQRFVAAVRRLHFGEAPAGFPGATAGAVPASIAAGSFEGALVANGEGALQASPAQVAAAYATIAAGGVYHAPSRTGSAGERVISEGAARAMLDLLDGAVNGPNATGAAARIDGLRVAGKTGTGDFSRDGKDHIYASFVGIAPREAPRVVLLVGADLAGEAAKDASGGRIAAPVFARIVGRAYAQ